MARTVTAKTRAASGSSTATQATVCQPLSSLRRMLSAARRGQGGLRSAVERGVAGMLPATPPTVVIYEMPRICLTDCATTLAGSGWKSTCERYDGSEPCFRLTAHSRTERMFLAVDEDVWSFDTMAYS